MDGEYSSWRPRTTPAEQPGGGLFGRLRANVQRGAARVQQAGPRATAALAAVSYTHLTLPTKA